MKRLLKKIILFLKYRNCLIKSKDISLNLKMGSHVRIYENVFVANNVEIGKYSYVSSFTKIYENTIIGAFCSIGPNCMIGPGNHDYKKLSTHPILYDKKWNNSLSKTININNKKTIIENDVWIGCNAVILNGVRIGTGAVIGAGTIVTKDVPPYAIVVGNPGKVIKYRFSNDIIEELLDSNWWEKEINEILDYDKENIKLH